MREKIFNIKDNASFEKCCLEVFRFQAKHNPVYQQYIRYRGTEVNKVKQLQDIPFLPVEFFKNHEIICQNQKAEVVFTSSGTTGMVSSRHLGADLSVYEQSFVTAFEHFYGKVSDYCILALLPAYMEREGSSWIYMMEKLVKLSGHKLSGFYLYEHDELEQRMEELEKAGQKTLLVGVSFALLDFVEKRQLQLKNTIVMETGGMKGRRKEMTKEELHEQLGNGFGLKNIHSEYGMTELLSQAYSNGKNIFRSPSWMKILIRDIYDPFCYLPHGKSGGINIIDLANYNSCSFIETKDIGKLYADGSFEVLGRFDASDTRGCNLLVV